MDDIDAFEKELMAMVSPDNDTSVVSPSGVSDRECMPSGGGDLLDFLGSSSSTPPNTHNNAVKSDDDLLNFLDFTGATPQESANKHSVSAPGAVVPISPLPPAPSVDDVDEFRSKVSAEVTDELQRGVILDALNELEGEAKGNEELEFSLLDGDGHKEREVEKSRGDAPAPVAPTEPVAPVEPTEEKKGVEHDARVEGDFTVWHRESEDPSQADAAHLHPCSYAAIKKHFFGAYGKSVSGASSPSSAPLTSLSMSSQRNGDKVEGWSPDHYYITSVVEVVVRPDVSLESLVSAATAAGKALRLPMARPQVDQLLLLGNRRRIDDEREEARALKAATQQKEKEKEKETASVPKPTPSIRDFPPEHEPARPEPSQGGGDGEAAAAVAAAATAAAAAAGPAVAPTGLFSSSVVAGPGLNEGLSSFAAGVRTWGGSLFGSGPDNVSSGADDGGRGGGSAGDAEGSGGEASRSSSTDHAGAGAGAGSSFLGISIGTVASALLGLEDEQNSIYSAKNRREWNADYDLLDIRVCVSKELNQRTMVAQFLKRLDGPEAHAADTAITHTHATVSPADKPHVTRFVEALKTGLRDRHLLLSSLYTAPVGQVCALQDSRAFGLCDHYYLQLSAMYHSSTLLRLEQPLVAMSEWAQKAERSTACLVTMLRVMVEKEHGLPMPVYLPPMPLASDSNPPGIVPESEKGLEGGGTGETGIAEKGDEEDEEEDEESKITLVQLFDKRAREAASSSSKGAAHRGRVGSIATSQAILQQPHYSSEGLAKCLLAINSLTDSVIKHCDKVATRHVDDKNAEIVRLLGALTSYKLSIVQTIVDGTKAAQASPVGQTFLRLFREATVCLPLPPSPSREQVGVGVAFTRYPGGSTEINPAAGLTPSSSPEAAGGDSGGTGGLLGWASSVLLPSPAAPSNILSPAADGSGGGGSPEPNKEMKITKAALMANRLKELRSLRKDAESASREAGKDKGKDRSPARPIAGTDTGSSASTTDKEGAREDIEEGVVAVTGLDFRCAQAVVLYYCSVLADSVDYPEMGAAAGKAPPSTAATLYVTQRHLCLYLGIPALAVGLQGLSTLTSSLSALTPTKTALLAGEDVSTPAPALATAKAAADSHHQPLAAPTPAASAASKPSGENSSAGAGAGAGCCLVFPLGKLHRSSVQRTSNVLGVETTFLQLNFYQGNRAVNVRPVVEDVERLRLLLSELTEISTNMDGA